MAENMGREPLIIAIVGPESTGKTTLAQQLALHLDGVLAEEYSREYLHSIGRPYLEEDLVAVAEGQFRNEQRALQMGRPIVVCDTDLTVIRVWSEVRYGRLDHRIEELLRKQPPRIHLLTAPDLAWEPDPLRENPHDRAALFDRYEHVLKGMGSRFHVISGFGEARLQHALSALHELQLAD